MSGEKKKKKAWVKYIAIGVYLAICFVIGVKLGKEIGSDIKKGESLSNKLISYVWAYIWLIVSVYLHIIIHEAGHLVFGLMSGYKFSSFRIMSFMWLNENGKIKYKRLKVAGMGGQCLMAPPDLKDGKIPVVLCNLGGSLMNFIASAAAFFVLVCVIVIKGGIGAISDSFLIIVVIFVAIGLFLAVSNAVPLKTGTINNDGYNTVALRKSKAAMFGYWMQLKMNAEIAKGRRLKEMPAEWFVVPSDEDMKNAMAATIAVYACNRLMDEGKYEEAYRLMNHILKMDSGIVELHRDLLTCDCMYCEMIGENRREIIDGMYTNKLKKLMNAMKKFPSVIRTEYAYALFVENDEKKAEKKLEFFEKAMKKYPYESDIQSERELMEYAREKYNQQ